jgi:DHA1 family bicyclomycin/chloramphenicol resistance-like MFS transporter
MNTKDLARWEFVALMATITSMVAFAIDSMLPAFPAIGAEFLIKDQSSLQNIIAILFLGFGFGQIIFGPLSDVLGRKPPIYMGMFIFAIGSVVSGFAPNYELFLFGRFLQGMGGASPRIISLALIRDRFSGDAMAQVTSLVMTVFILVPAVAPSLGQLVLSFSGWRNIFIILFVFSILVFIWFAVRQPETLEHSKRKKFKFSDFAFAVKETLSQSTTVCCILVSGMIFGIFVGYLGVVQSLFQNVFGEVNRFPMFFALLALSIGAASFFNSRLVMAYGMRKIIYVALVAVLFFSVVFNLYYRIWSPGEVRLEFFMLYLMCTFAAIGFLFGNLNALAMNPLGHVAGVGSALLGFLQSFISVVIGVQLGKLFFDNVLMLSLSFGCVSLLCAVVMYVERRLNVPGQLVKSI